MISEAGVMKMVLRDGKHMLVSANYSPRTGCQFYMLSAQFAKMARNCFLLEVSTLCVCECARVCVYVYVCIFFLVETVCSVLKLEITTSRDTKTEYSSSH